MYYKKLKSLRLKSENYIVELRINPGYRCSSLYIRASPCIRFYVTIRATILCISQGVCARSARAPRLAYVSRLI